VRIEVIAPYEVRFQPDSLRWVDGKVHGTLIASAWAAGNLSRVTAFPTDPANRDELKVSMDQWEAGSPGTQIRRFTVQPLGKAEVTVILHCGETVVQQADVAQPTTGASSPAQLVYLMADPGLRHLGHILSPTIDPEPKGRKNKARQKQQATAHDFAGGVGRLFTLAGWHVDVLQSGETSEFVDAVAFHPAERICLAIECTIAPPSKDGKLSNLAARRNRIAEELGNGWEVLALLATPVEATGVAESDRNAAKANRIITLDGDDLHQMLELVRTGCGPGRLLEALRTGQ